MPYLAHIRQAPYAEQTVKEHLEGTARLAETFAGRFGCAPLASFCGQLHDAGKYSDAFQRRLHGENLRIDHSTAGAQLAERLLPGHGRHPGVGRLLGYCIAGHHGGLPEGGTQADTEADSTLLGRLGRKLEPWDAFFSENGPMPPAAKLPLQLIGKGGFTYSFWVRMLYSCLVDADFLDTEAFMRAGATGRQPGAGLDALMGRLQTKLSTFKGGSLINDKRCQILRDCLAAASGPPGLYSLTVPTGGGKTFSSLAFALAHALHSKQARVIYVIPYTSILGQNAGEFKKVLGDENVLEHHAGFEFPSDDDEVFCPQKLAAENWDAPLVMTTNVQFFESLFANKPSRCRKLHNIAGSVLIFDEAQMIPTGYLAPCVRAIAELVHNYGCTAVLCSATQPALQPFFPAGMPIREICADTAGLYAFFRRTRLTYCGALSNEELLSRVQAGPGQALIIVNTRAHAQDLFCRLTGAGCFHLSTTMCSRHRRQVIDEIRRRLGAGEPCRVVSTQLIEAGVDVDFPVVYRAMAGLDSLVQSAGRCNREGGSAQDGRFPIADVFVFDPEETYVEHMPHSLRRPLEMARSTMGRIADPLSPAAIEDYYTNLYYAEGEGLDRKGIVGALEGGIQGFSFNFPQVDKDFRLIEEDTVPVIVPFDDGARALLARLERETPDRELIRGLQPYTVSVRRPSFALLCDMGGVGLVNGVGVLVNESLYDGATGLRLPRGEGARAGQGIFI